LATERYSVGLDYGTNSVRAIIVEVSTGREIATAVYDYQRGDQGVITDDSNPHIARQHPADYVEGLRACTTAALEQARAEPGFAPERVIGIGVDTTGSTPLPVDRDGVPLAFHAEFQENLNALAWLWKDHSAIAEAEQITAMAARHRPHYLAKSGGTYSSEWFFSKIWHCLNVDPRVFAAAHSWVELCDYVPALLTGATRPEQIKWKNNFNTVSLSMVLMRQFRSIILCLAHVSSSIGKGRAIAHKAFPQRRNHVCQLLEMLWTTAFL